MKWVNEAAIIEQNGLEDRLVVRIADGWNGWNVRVWSVRRTQWPYLSAGSGEPARERADALRAARSVRLLASISPLATLARRSRSFLWGGWLRRLLPIPHELVAGTARHAVGEVVVWLPTLSAEHLARSDLRPIVGNIMHERFAQG